MELYSNGNVEIKEAKVYNLETTATNKDYELVEPVEDKSGLGAGVGNMSNNNGTTRPADNNIYNVLGQRVSAEIMHQGVFISNGKKIMIR